MLDIHMLRKDPELIKKIVEQKKAKVDVARLFDLDKQVVLLQNNIQVLNTKKKKAAAERNVEEGRSVKHDLKTEEAKLATVQEEFVQLWQMVPNIPSAATPVGKDESENVVVRTVGEPTKLSFVPKDHMQLGELHGWIDTERAGKVSGSRFAYLKGDLVRIQFALVDMVMNIATNKEKIAELIQKNNLAIVATPFVPVLPPLMIKPEAMQKMARLEPRDERYHIPSDDVYLIGSSEHTMGAMHMGETFTESQLPIRYIGYSSCFRREAGSYGKDVQGILRQHQFDKLEMEVFSTKATGEAEHKLLVAIQEEVLRQLGLPYRMMQICTGDMGGPDEQQVDMEVWIPSQGKYRETHTADFMGDYQARRLGTRVKLAGKGDDGKPKTGTEFVAMNDATALAMGRAMIAIMENNQREDGSIAIPKVLQPYFGGKEVFELV